MASSDPHSRPRFPFTRPAIPAPDEWVPFLEASYGQRWYANGGPVARRLERELIERTAPSDREAILVSSATAGLVACLLALDVRGPVAMPSYTFPAVAHAVQLAGGTPLFCDVDRETGELDPAAVGSALRAHRLSAIIHVRAFGLCRELSAVEETARAAGVPLIVDSAAAFGGKLLDGTPVGHAGGVEVFSFHATKVFGIGEGGAVFASPPLAARIRRKINFDLEGADVVGRALNGKLSDLSAAVGLAMLRRLDEHLAERRYAVGRLLEAAAGAGVGFPVNPGEPPWQCLPLVLGAQSQRDTALEALADLGIEARTYYSPGLHRTRAFRDCPNEPLPVTEALSERTCCLPVYSDLAPDELEEVAASVQSVLTPAARPVAEPG